MGYSTDFYGQFDLDKPLTPAHKAYLEAFSKTRRMKRDAAKTALLPDPIREAVGLPVGEEGGYYVGGSGEHDFSAGVSVINYNEPPTGQPGLWCQWIPIEDDDISWDEGEKFYHYVEWLEYIIEHFLKPWGYVLKSGQVEWKGEDSEDLGIIETKDNKVVVTPGKVVYESATDNLIAALARLLDAPCCNLDDQEDEDCAAIENAIAVLAKAKGEAADVG